MQNFKLRHHRGSAPLDQPNRGGPRDFDGVQIRDGWVYGPQLEVPGRGASGEKPNDALALGRLDDALDADQVVEVPADLARTDQDVTVLMARLKRVADDEDSDGLSSLNAEIDRLVISSDPWATAVNMAYNIHDLPRLFATVVKLGKG